MSLIPSFQIQTNEKIKQGQAAVGRFDGEHYALAAATAAGKIFLHQPCKQARCGYL